MSRTKPWKVGEALWERVEPLLPERPEREEGKEYKRRPGGGEAGGGQAQGV